ncbi:MAG: GWxTD domain-containing protein [Terriglobia bacterium]
MRVTTQVGLSKSSCGTLRRAAWIGCSIATVGGFFCLLVQARPLRPGAESLHGSAHRGLGNQKEGGRWYDKWVDEVVPYIITDSERSEFERLTTDQERQKFIDKFWEIRNPNPGSPQNAFKKEYYRRLAYAKQHFHYLVPGYRDDRARIYIQFGPPDRIELPAPRSAASTAGAGPTPVEEQWVYQYMDGIGKNVIVQFTRSPGTHDYRVIVDPLTLIDHTPSTAPLRHPQL